MSWITLLPLGVLIILVVALGGWMILVIRDTIRGEGRFGVRSQSGVTNRSGEVLLKGVVCPRCGAPAKEFRIPANMREVLWGGQTCGSCNTPFDKWGKAIEG